MPDLYHFSDDPAIAIFEPRPSRHGVNLVWAVDAAHAWSYSVPRECPRACFWAADTTDDADVQRFLHGDRAKIFMAIEDRWLPALELGVLHRYSLPGDTFVLNDAIAGHWVSRTEVMPLEVREVRDLAGQVRAAGLELRTLESLRETLAGRHRPHARVLRHAPAQHARLPGGWILRTGKPPNGNTIEGSDWILFRLWIKRLRWNSQNRCWSKSGAFGAN